MFLIFKNATKMSPPVPDFSLYVECGGCTGVEISLKELGGGDLPKCLKFCTEIEI